MNKAQENLYSDNFFYVFVDLKHGDLKPDFYVAPSKTVADYKKTRTRSIKINLKKWETT